MTWIDMYPTIRQDTNTLCPLGGGTIRGKWHSSNGIPIYDYRNYLYPWQGNGGGLYHFMTFLPLPGCGQDAQHPEKVLSDSYGDEPSILAASYDSADDWHFTVRGIMKNQTAGPADGHPNPDNYLYGGAPPITYQWTYRFNRYWGHTSFDKQLSVSSPITAHRIQMIVDTNTDRNVGTPYPLNYLTAYFQPGYSSPQSTWMSAAGNDEVGWEQGPINWQSGYTNAGRLSGSTSTNDRTLYLRSTRGEQLASWYDSSYDTYCQGIEVLGTHTDCNNVDDHALSLVNHRFDVNFPNWSTPGDLNPHRPDICGRLGLNQFGLYCTNPTWNGVFDSGTHNLGAF